MARWTADDVYVSLAGTDVSALIDSVEVSEEYGVKAVPGMGATAVQKILNKAKECTISLEFLDDFAASQTWATLKTKIGSNTAFTAIVRPTSATASATNPQATMMALLPKWNPIAGAYGDVGKTSITLENGDTTGIVWTP
jgi:hypothetical protein